MKTIILIILTLVLCISASSNGPKTISKNKMKVSWYHQKDSVYFEMAAPTTGWVTIGFNTNSGIQGAYLLMGRVVDGIPSVVEHFTVSAGNYKSIKVLGEEPSVTVLSGLEANGLTKIKFALPIKANNRYQKELNAGKAYSLILAYSQSDDFQHHSMMRTAVQIKL